MKRCALLLLVFGLFVEPAFAHRLDEYLQASVLSVEPGAIILHLRMVPGVAVAPQVIAEIDRNGDGLLSPSEQKVYSARVLSDLRLSEDGRRLSLHVTAMSFPDIAQLRMGLGQIDLAMSAEVTQEEGRHDLSLENLHLPAISVYLVNALIPVDESLHIEDQRRSRNQSSYRVVLMEGVQHGSSNRSHNLNGLGAAFRLGMRHIAEGTDHLLFLLTLLLPAPLLVRKGSWAGAAPLKQSLFHVLSIVTAFTVGHSITLALAGFGMVRLPSRPVEVLIAVSILLSAIHAAYPLFPGWEAAVAATFGLVHGLAFSSAITELGITGWYRLISIVGFNLGIETMQLAVVIVVLPAMLLLSRTRLYRPFRYLGAVVAALAASAWITERILDRANTLALLVEKISSHEAVLVGVLWMLSLTAWAMRAKTQDAH